MRDRLLGHPERDSECGIYAVLFVLLLTVFMMAGALAVDMGSVYFARHSTQSVADMAATAGGLELEPTDLEAIGTPVGACQTAWAYAITNLRDAPNSLAGSSPCDSPGLSAACDPNSPNTVTRDVLDDDGNRLYSISITWPVPDADPAMAGRSTPDIDGTACQRLGVQIERVNNLLLAGFGGGPDTITVGSTAVTRSQTSQTQGDLVALVVLERTDCQALTSSGQGNVEVEAVQVEDGNGNLVWVPGAITVDSDGTTNCTSNPRYAIAVNSNQINSYIIAEGTPEGAPGVLLSHAALVNPSRSADPSRCGPNGSSTASTPIQPCPVGGNRVTRAPIDHRYNCKAAYPGLEIAGCPNTATMGDYVDQLVARLQGASANPSLTGTASAFLPGGVFQEYPRNPTSFPNDSCTLNSAVNIVLPAGNWFINCPNTGGSGNTPGFRMSNNGARFTAGTGEIVFAGGVDVSNGVFTVGQRGPGQPSSIVYVRPHPSNDGDFEKGAQGQMNLLNTFVYLQQGVINVGAGDPTLTWIAPDDDNFVFDDLALWSDSAKQHLLGGQGNLDVDGTFFTPNANPFNFSGQGAQSQARAQFITRKLTFSGQAGLVMAPDPERTTSIPIQGVTLIR